MPILNWGEAPADTGGGGYDVPLPGQQLSPSAPGQMFQEQPPPPGVNPQEYKKKRAENAANEMQNLQQKSLGAKDALDHLFDYTKAIEAAPEGSFGHTMGSEHFRQFVDAPLGMVGFQGPNDAARGAEAVNAKAADVTAALFRARFGGGAGETGQRGNRPEFEQIRNSIGTSNSYDKTAAHMAAIGHAKEMATQLNNAFDQGGITKQMVQSLGPEKLQWAIQHGGIDPHRFLDPVSPEEARALTPGTVFKTQDGRIMTR